MASRPRVAVHKFSSCDGCQLAFLNLGPALLELAERVELVHFVEAGAVDADAAVDVAFVEGSVTTPGDADRIQRVRESAKFLVTIGACATAGGIQALRNGNDSDAWMRHVYARPEWIATLEISGAISEHVKVDFELWGCPVNARQVIATVNSLLLGVSPSEKAEKVCLECKRSGAVCVMVTRGVPCMGPVTRTGCGALCPSFGRDCYGCFGPAEAPNTRSMSRRFEGLGLLPAAGSRRFAFINNDAPAFREAARTSSQEGPDG
jgi:coenzyme F420-reducing hydrogenase gamma subunit